VRGIDRFASADYFEQRSLSGAIFCCVRLRATPVAVPVIRGNVVAIDTGAAFGVLGESDLGAMTLVDILADARLIEDEATRPAPENRIRVIAGDVSVYEPVAVRETSGEQQLPAPGDGRY
jgi:hypothetical protein